MCLKAGAKAIKTAILKKTVTHLITLFLSNGFPVLINSPVRQSSRIDRDISYLCDLLEFLNSSEKMMRLILRNYGVYETTTATGSSLNKRINEHYNGCARAL